MNLIRQTARLILRIFTALLSLVILVGAGFVALAVLSLAALAVLLRVKWLERKFSRQPDPQIINAEKTENGHYSVSGL